MSAVAVTLGWCESTGRQVVESVSVVLQNPPSNLNCSCKREGPPLLGINKTLEVFEDITHLLISAIKLYKHGVGLKALSDMWGIIDSVKELVLDLPPALPELMDLDSEECGRLGAAAHKMLTEIAKAFEA